MADFLLSDTMLLFGDKHDILLGSADCFINDGNSTDVHMPSPPLSPTHQTSPTFDKETDWLLTYYPDSPDSMATTSSRDMDERTPSASVDDEDDRLTEAVVEALFPSLNDDSMDDEASSPSPASSSSPSLVDSEDSFPLLVSILKATDTEDLICDATRSDLAATSRVVVKTKLHACPICLLSFADEAELISHRDKSRKSLSCCACGKHFSIPAKWSIHQRKHDKRKEFQCEHCNMMFAQHITLTRHQARHCKSLARSRLAKSSPVAFASQIRPEVGNKSAVVKVNVTTDAVEVRQRCQICKSQFENVQAVADHVEFHRSKRTCCACHKQLGNRVKLANHHRTHTKETPYSCSVCDRQFAELSTLRKHETTHGAKTFVCGQCSRAFVRKDYLVKHEIRFHSGPIFTCSRCKKFKTGDVPAMVDHLALLQCL